MKPRLSVLVPATRGGGFLQQALESVLSQDFGDFELLVSDDSRGRAVRDTVETFADPRLKLLEGPRAGQVANTAFLWDQAQGELIKYLHDDDYLLPGALAALIKPLDDLPHASFTFVQRRLLHSDGRITGDEPELRPRIYIETAVVNDLLGGAHNPIGEPTCSLFRRTSLDAVGEYEGFRIRSLIDVAMYLKAVERGLCVGVHRNLAVVRLHAEQFSKMSPERSAGVTEWELLIRLELMRGRLLPDAALRGVNRLLKFYRLYRKRWGDVALLLPGLEALAKDLRAKRDRNFMDSAFHKAWARAEAIIEERKAAARRPA
jgi:glycosyltransferase involved in cell wall biosynthesis